MKKFNVLYSYRHKLREKYKYKFSLKQQQAQKLIEASRRHTCGGTSNRKGDGKVWYSYSFINDSCWVRDIKAGQWNGYWRLENV